MFVATSGLLNIPRPLFDRAEVIEAPGYTEMALGISPPAIYAVRWKKGSGLRDGELEHYGKCDYRHHSLLHA